MPSTLVTDSYQDPGNRYLHLLLFRGFGLTGQRGCDGLLVKHVDLGMLLPFCIKVI